VNAAMIHGMSRRSRQCIARPPLKMPIRYRLPFSRRTPLNFFAAFFVAGFFTAMNSPDVLLRLVHAVAPASVVFSCERFFTAPLRALSPTGLLTPIFVSLFQCPHRACLTMKTLAMQKVPVRNRLHGKTLMDRRQKRGRTASTPLQAPPGPFFMVERNARSQLESRFCGVELL
jgi:hypothetical protein